MKIADFKKAIKEAPKPIFILTRIPKWLKELNGKKVKVGDEFVFLRGTMVHLKTKFNVGTSPGYFKFKEYRAVELAVWL